MKRLARRMRRIIITVSAVMIMTIWKRIEGIRTVGSGLHNHPLFSYG
jgi:hypothetical protein